MFWNFSVFLAIQLQLYHAEQILRLLAALGFYDLPIKYYYVRFPVMQNQNSPIGQTQQCAVGLSIPWTEQFQGEYYILRPDWLGCSCF